jgi:hypothetical protein
MSEIKLNATEMILTLLYIIAQLSAERFTKLNPDHKKVNPAYNITDMIYKHRI